MDETRLKKDTIDVLDVIVIIAVGISCMAIVFIFLIQSDVKITSNNQTAQAADAMPNVDIENPEVPVATSTPFQSDFFAELHLEAQAAYVADMKTGKILFEKNSTTTLPLASLTKLMTGAVAADIMPLSSEVTVLPDDLLPIGDSGLTNGEKWSLENLLKFTLMVSSNDGAHAIARVGGTALAAGKEPGNERRYFIAQMNEKARQMGLGAKFVNETGLDESSLEAGGYGNARDVGKLFSYMLARHAILMKATGRQSAIFKSLDERSHTGSNTNILIGQLSGISASKTGFSALAGGNLVIELDPVPERKIILVILGSSFDGRFDDMKKLVGAVRKTISYEETQDMLN